MLSRLAETENHFGHAVTQGAMVVYFGESQILEGQVAHAFERGIDIGGASANFFKQRAELIFHHPLPNISGPVSESDQSAVLHAMFRTIPTIDFENELVESVSAVSGALGGLAVAGAAFSAISTTLRSGPMKMISSGKLQLCIQ
jgi:hypothetical protein